MSQLSTSDHGPAYALDNDADTAPETLDCLSEILDDHTIATLDAVMDWHRPGLRCLELGAGNGSIANYLHKMVNPTGRQVTAVDIKPRHLRVRPQVQVLTLDVRNELPPGPWDLIHARLLLAHLPQRREILRRCADALAPGGMLAVEEWGGEGAARVVSDPGGLTAALYQHYSHALLETFASAGSDLSWCSAVPAAMIGAALTLVSVETHAQSWRGGTAGTRLPIAVSTEMQPQLVAQGMPAEDLDRLRDALTDPELVLLGNQTWSTLGRKPATGGRP